MASLNSFLRPAPRRAKSIIIILFFLTIPITKRSRVSEITPFTFAEDEGKHRADAKRAAGRYHWDRCNQPLIKTPNTMLDPRHAITTSTICRMIDFFNPAVPANPPRTVQASQPLLQLLDSDRCLVRETPGARLNDPSLRGQKSPS